MNALGTVPGHNDFINIHELRQVVSGLKNNRAVGNDGIPSEVYQFQTNKQTIMIYSKNMAVQRIAYTRINSLAFKVSSVHIDCYYTSSLYNQ